MDVEKKPKGITFSKIFSALFYCGITATAILTLLLLIFSLAPESLENDEALLYSQRASESGDYVLTLSGGAEITVSGDEMIEENLKEPMYFMFLTVIFDMAFSSAAFLILSRFFGNLENGRMKKTENIAYIAYIGLILIVAVPISDILLRLYNRQILAAVNTGLKIEQSLAVSPVSFLPGVFLILLALMAKKFFFNRRVTETNTQVIPTDDGPEE